MTLNITQGDSTLTSSSSNAHLRRSLQALPHIPDHTRNGKSDGKRAQKHERRRVVEHFIPPPWVPDAKAESCMRCGRLFGLLRRRHHCRLCGRVVCADCSTKVCFLTPLCFIIGRLIYNLAVRLSLYLTRKCRIKRSQPELAICVMNRFFQSYPLPQISRLVLSAHRCRQRLARLLRIDLL